MSTKGRVCSRSCLDYLLIEVVQHYANAPQGPTLEVALEAIGMRVGVAIVERCSRDKAPLSEPLEVVKFLCKEFWTEAFGKGVDNLRTNHRGTFVLRDVQFSWLESLHPNQLPAAPAAGSEDGAAVAPTPSRASLAGPYSLLPCALLRGALGALGLDASVNLDASSLPQADFTIVLAAPGNAAGSEV